MDVAGTGTMVAPGARVTVEGLRTNDTYVFALAAYDEAGTLLGGLGTSSVELLAGIYTHLISTIGTRIVAPSVAPQPKPVGC